MQMLFRVFLAAVGAALIALGAGCDCNGGGFPVDAAVPDAVLKGTVSLAWSLTDLAEQPILCDQVGASFVFLQLRSHSSLSGAVASFGCQNSPSMSAAIDADTYDVSFELHGLSLTAVTAPEQIGVVVAADRDTRLAPVTFKVDTAGKLALSLAAPPHSSNCKSAAMGGAGITGMTITLVHTGGGCAPVTFLHTRGSTMLGSYTVNCGSPQVAPCIETDETLSVPSLPSGPYGIHVRGKLGAVDCWANDDALQVPPQSKSLTQTLNLAFDTSGPGC
jgi:hypothetical protein